MKENDNINEIVIKFYDALLAYTVIKVGDKQIAEDIVQEVMYRITKATNAKVEIRHIRAWLYQTTRHIIADHFREKAQRPEYIGEFIDVELIQDDGGDIMISDGIVPMIKLLPIKYSQPLIWSDIDNVPQKEIAHKLGIGLSATKMRIQRARKKLHQIFIECCEIIYDNKGRFVNCYVKGSCEPLLKIKTEVLSKRSLGSY